MSIPRSIRVVLLSLTTLLLLWNCQIDMPPVARDDTAATDRNVPVTITVVANDTASTGRIVASTVAVVVGPGHGTAHAQADGTVTYTPATDFVGTDSFSYVVTDTAVETSNTATVTVTVRAVNRAPVANAGPDLNAVTGRPVTLDGAQSFDPDRDPLTYAWQFVAVPPTSTVTTASLANAQTAAPSFTPDVDGTYDLELTVSDGMLSSTAQVQVIAMGLTNVPPNANAGQPQTAQVGTVVLLDGTSSQDPDNGPQPLTYQWSFLAVPPGSTLTTADLQGATTPLANFTPDMVGVYRVGLQVSDGRDANQTEVQITATPPNVAPNANAGPPMAVQLGDAVTLNGTASHDPDNGPQPLTYQWTLVSKPVSSGLTNASIQGATTATPSCTPDVAGIYVLRLDVSDGALSSFAQVMLKANVAPVAVDDTYNVDQDQTLTVPAPGVLGNDTDGNNDPLTVVLGHTVSHGALTLNADGSFTYTPTTGFLGTDSFTYQANDGSVDSNMAAVTITVTQSIPTAITLTPNPLTLTPSTTGSVTVSLTRPAGPAGQVVTLLSSNSAVASVLPSVTIPANASSTTVTVTAGTMVGTATLSASATGLTGGSTKVNVGCPTMTVTPPGVTAGTINVAFSQSFSQSGAVGTATFTVASGTLPTGLTLASSGLLAGTPTQTGSFPITVRVTDTTSCTATSATYTLTIGQGPAITSANATTFTVGGAGTFTVTAAGSPTPSIALGGASLPAGVTFVDNGNGTGTLSGTPAAVTGGTYALTFTATNTVGSSPGQSFTLTVQQAPTIASANATTFTVGTAGTFTITTTGFPPPSITRGGVSLPGGVTFVDNGNGTGTLSGTPGPGTGGTYALTFTATNTVGSSPGQAFTLTVNQTPAITSANNTTFTVGGAGTFTVTAAGSPTPSIALGGASLPAGVTFVDNGNGTGTLSGTPAAVTGGTYALTFTATNTVGSSPGQSFTLTVQQAPTIASANATTFTVGTAGTFTITTTGFPPPSITRGGVSLPGGVTFVDNGNGTGTLSGTPGPGTGGTYALTFTATNTVGSSPGQAFTLTVNQAPAITSANATTFTVGTAGTFTITTTGFPTPTSTRGGAALPAGVTFVDNGNGTGTLSGTPAAGTGGTYGLTFTATNAVGSSPMQNFTLTVNQPPTITSANNTTFTVGGAGTFTVTAAGSPTPSIALGGASLPAGVTFVDNGNGTGTLSGTPAAVTGGTYALTFTATNTVGSSPGQSFTLTVQQAPTIASANATTFTVGTAGTFTITTTGFPPPSITRGGVSLPGGVTFVDNGNGTGTLSGTPAAGTGGTYGLTFTATNAVGSSPMQNFTLTVNQPPTITSANNTTFTVGVVSTFTVTATGFPTPTFAVAGALPAGVTLNSTTGVLSGTPGPGTAGTYALTITASNGVGSPAMQNFTLTVLVQTNAQPETFANGVGNTQYVVGLAAPATPAVVVAGSVLANDTGPGALSAGPANITSTNASALAMNVAMNPDGTFTYTPAVGFTGPSDTFTYTLTDGNGITDTAVVTINLSDVVWYVNNTYTGANGASDGRSHRPFTTLNAAETPSLADQYIFVHQGSGNTSGGIVLDSGQTLWGQGTTFTLNGLTIGATPDKPTVTGTITLATNATVSSLDINTGANTGITNPTSAIAGVNIKNGVTVTTTTGTAVSLSDIGGTLTFQSISATGAANGISLTKTTGSFTVTGDEASALNGTGGTITNTTGDGISLINVAHASFSRMNITDSGTNGIFETSANAFVSITITNNNVTTGLNGVNAISLNALQSSVACFNVRSNMTMAPNANGILVRVPSGAVRLERGDSPIDDTPVNVLKNNNVHVGIGEPAAVEVAFGSTIVVVENGTCAAQVP